MYLLSFWQRCIRATLHFCARTPFPQIILPFLKLSFSSTVQLVKKRIFIWYKWTRDTIFSAFSFIFSLSEENAHIYYVCSLFYISWAKVCWKENCKVYPQTASSPCALQLYTSPVSIEWVVLSWYLCVQYGVNCTIFSGRYVLLQQEGSSFVSDREKNVMCILYKRVFC